MKKLLSVILALSVIAMLFVTPAIAQDEASSQIPSKVEIAFRVGDSILSINGADVEVETPYIAGEGTTLVPIRVITEAFGAKVGWIAESKTITLEYPDVNITLQIDNTTAIINTHTETLAVAPTLSPNGVTMVPLRFISETFGAEVGWDAGTSSITVTKEIAEQGDTVTDAVKLPMLGDSYYNWMMDTPKNMFMSDRTFDGIYTEFTDDNANELTLEIFTVDEDFSFDEDFSDVKNRFDGYTFMKADKLTDAAGNPYMHFQIKDKEDYIDYRGYYYNNRIYDLILVCPVDSAEKDQLTAIMDTFKIGFTPSSDVHDLSNVVNGYRIFLDEKMKLSLKIPENWMDVSEDAENEFAFRTLESKDSYNEIHLGIYSKSETVSAKLLAEKDHANNSKYANPKVYTFSPVSDFMSPGGKYAGYYYSSEVKGTDSFNHTDIFFERGDYVYNISFMADPDADFQSTVLESLTVDPLNKDEIGTYIRNDLETDITTTSKAGSWTLTLPITWAKGAESASGAAYMHKMTGSLINFVVATAGYSIDELDLSNAVQSQQQQILKNSSNTLVQATKAVKLNKNTYYKMSYSSKSEGYKYYYISYYRLAGNNIYQFVMSVPEYYYSDVIEDEFEQIVGSLMIAE